MKNVKFSIKYLKNFFERQEKILLFIFFIIIFFQCLFSLIQKSSTYDEGTFIMKGYDFFKKNIYSDLYDTPLVNLYSLYFLFMDTSKISYKILLNISRMIVVFLSIILSYFVYSWSKKLFGIIAGFFSLFLYTFSPNILAHSMLVTTDLLTTAFIFISLYYFYRVYKEKSLKNLTFFSISFSLALISKFTSILLFLLFFFILLYLLFTRKFKLSLSQFKKLLFILIIILFIINVSYLFDGFMMRIGEYKFESFFMKSLQNSYTNWIPLPLPKNYVIGFDISINYTKIGHPYHAFLMGECKYGSWWYYFIIAFLIKTPIPTLILLLISLFILYFKKNYQNLLFLFFPILFFFFIFSFLNNINVGLRHILMIYPFIFVLCGSILSYKFKNKKIYYLILILILWYFFESIMIFPHYLVYFNEFISGPKNGYKYLIDSNIDWGQDNILIDKYISESKFTIIKNPGCEFTEGIIAVNVNTLQGLFEKNGCDCYKWLRDNYEPFDYVGYSWLIYNVTKQ